MNEPALYKLILRSNKPKAEAFANWVCEEVCRLPRRRITGMRPAKPIRSYVLTASNRTKD
ncbi:hypothetical protein C2U68_19865 [Methylomonas koyamae]|nr:hypothetical protein C2U68_19865 [Methylomonas koyamae]